MKEKLEKFELSINEDIYLQGEELYDKAAVSDLQKLENNLYTAVVVDNNYSYEVEILNPASLHRRTTCDCSQYKKYKLCRHIVATLLAIRKKISKPKNKLRKARNNSKNLFTTKAILELVSEKELKSFILDYSRKDKKFDLSFKARYAKTLDLEDNSIKYKSILDALIPLAKDSGYKINQSKINQVNKFFKEFLIQIEDSFALHQYAEAFSIFSPVFKKISYVKHYARNEDHALLDLDLRYHQVLERFLSSEAAPELIDQIVDFGLSLSSYSYYQLSDLSLNIPYIVYNFDSSYSKDCIAILNEKLNINPTPLLLALYFIFNENDIHPNYLKSYYENQQFLYKAIKLLIRHNKLKIARKVLNIVDGLDWNNSSFDELKFSIIAREGHYTEMVEFGLNRFMKTKKIYYINVLLNHLPEDKTAFMLQELSLRRKRISSRMLCEIYLKLGQMADLLDILIDARDLNLLLDFDFELFNNYPEKVEQLYLELMENYLTDHVGYEANKYFDGAIDHLVKIGRKSVAKQLKQMVKEKFPHRKRFLSSYH